jgi:hypothetical protein
MRFIRIVTKRITYQLGYARRFAFYFDPVLVGFCNDSDRTAEQDAGHESQPRVSAVRESVTDSSVEFIRGCDRSAFRFWLGFSRSFKRYG